MKFSVKSLTGREIYFDMDTDNTIGQIKNMILEREGIPIYQQRLIFNRKELKDNTQTLYEIGVTDNTIIHMMIAFKEDPGVIEQRKKEHESKIIKMNERSKTINSLIVRMQSNEINKLLIELFHQISINKDKFDVNSYEKIFDIEEQIITRSSI